MTQTINQDLEILINEYCQDPNCAPYLWVSYETPSESERQQFCQDERVKDAHKKAVLKAIK